MKKIFKFICCGSVDDGKSTLIGRLLVETGNVKKDQLVDALKASQKLGSDKLEYGMLLDGLLSEREQQITIDIAHRYFDYNNTRFHILDCPGHKQYTKNMAIAAAMVDTAILVVDVIKGVSDQTFTHLNICKSFGLRNICCCLTKVDLLNENELQQRVDILQKDFELYAKDFENFDIIPVSAVSGYNLDRVLDKIVDYSDIEVVNNTNKIMHVHCVKILDGKRYYYVFPIDNIEPVVGEKYYLYGQSNTGISVTISKVVGYGCFNLKEDIDVQQGDVFSLNKIVGGNHFSAEIVWFDEPTEDMLLKHGTRVVKVVSYLDNEIVLDRNIFASAISEMKNNSLGIVIDNVSKKTIACVVFKGLITEFSENLRVSKREHIVFNSEIVADLGVENIDKVTKYLQSLGFNVEYSE